MFHVLHSAGGSNVLLDLVVDGKPHLAMPREIQRDHIHNTLIHVDFLAVSRTEKIAVDVPVVEVGDAVGVKEGGVVEHHLRDLHIESLPQDVPEHIEVDITDLNIGDMIHVRDVVVPRGRHDPHRTPTTRSCRSSRRPRSASRPSSGSPAKRRPRPRRSRSPRARKHPPRRARALPLPRRAARASPWTVARRRSGQPRRPIRQDPSQRRRPGRRRLASEAGERFRKARFVPVESAEIAIDGRKRLARASRSGS